ALSLRRLWAGAPLGRSRHLAVCGVLAARVPGAAAHATHVCRVWVPGRRWSHIMTLDPVPRYVLALRCMGPGGGGGRYRMQSPLDAPVVPPVPLPPCPGCGKPLYGWRVWDLQDAPRLSRWQRRRKAVWTPT